MSGTNNAIVSQVVAEALVTAQGNVSRASQIAVQALVGTLGFVNASQLVAEALIGTLGFVQVTQISVEILVARYVIPVPSIFPTLIGLGYSVVKRPIWNTATAQAASGREARLGLQSYPIYEFDLTYTVLSDGAAGVPASYASDLKTLMGFYNSTQGSLYSFLFLDPDDCTVTGQGIATGDGATTTFTFIRTFGGGDGSTTEPVGYLNNAVAPLIYVNGVLQNISTYTLLTTTAYAQQIKFTTAPAAGAAITATFGYYAVVRFKDDQYDFEKFMNQLWSLKKMTLRTVRV